MNAFFAWIVSALETTSAFTGDVFWTVATSPPALITLGLVAMAGWALSNLPLVDRLFPFLVPYTRAAWVAQLVASTALIFLLGFSFAHERSEAEQAKNDLAWANWNLGMKAAAEETAFQLMNDARRRATAAEEKLRDYETKFGKNPLDPPPAYLEWLRSLQQRPLRHASAGALQPQRGLVARVRAIGGKRE